MPINHQLLDYITVTSPDKVRQAIDVSKRGTDLYDTMHSIDVVIGDKYAQVEPISRRQNYTPIGKFHIPKAWNLITGLLADEGLSTKVMTLGGRALVRGVQAGAAGKNIVIYFDQSEAQDKAKFERILTQIERIFEEHDIAPGPDIKYDKPIPGSRFSYMRYGDTDYHKRSGKALRDDTPPPKTPMDDIVIAPGQWASRVNDKTPTKGGINRSS